MLGLLKIQILYAILLATKEERRVMKQDKFKVCSLTGPICIRQYLKSHLGFSTSLIARVKFGGVFVNEKEVHMRATVENGDEITIVYPEEESENIRPIKIPLDIVYEDEHILAINKPINMPVHPSKGNSLPTLAEGVRAYVGHPFVFRAVNRLDRDTSGLVLIAKDPLTSAILCRTIKSGKMKKKYLAVVTGTPSPSEGVIDAPIERESEGNMKRIVREDGKPSNTRYRVIRTLEVGKVLVEVEPLTGRTHQIRVHMAHIGHPLFNDFLYGTRAEAGTYMLHCSTLEFEHPYTNEILRIVAKAPFD